MAGMTLTPEDRKPMRERIQQIDAEMKSILAGRAAPDKGQLATWKKFSDERESLRRRLSDG
jgi:hypothetical protein